MVGVGGQHSSPYLLVLALDDFDAMAKVFVGWLVDLVRLVSLFYFKTLFDWPGMCLFQCFFLSTSNNQSNNQTRNGMKQMNG